MKLTTWGIENFPLIDLVLGREGEFGGFSVKGVAFGCHLFCV